MTESYVRIPRDSTDTGTLVRSRQRTVNQLAVEEQYYIEQDERVISYKGRYCTFRIPGRAATQNIWSIYNAAASPVIVDVRRVVTDLVATANKAAITTEAPLLRLVRVTAAPTSGTTTAVAPMDTAFSSSASVVCRQDASADRTLSGTPLAVTSVGTIGEEYASRVITSEAGQEAADSVVFMGNSCEYTLRASEGMALVVDIGSAGTNPATDLWTVMIEWLEYTLP